MSLQSRLNLSVGLALLGASLVASPVRADAVEVARPVEHGATPPGKTAPPEPQGFVEVDLPPTVLDLEPDALGCPSPCATGVVEARHPFYDVYLSCDTGAFTARTGANHSVTALAGGPQNVIFGGANGGPGTSDISWRFHDQGLTLTNPGGGGACIFDPPDTAVEPNSIGIEQEWTTSPAAGITCTLRQEIVAFGTTEADSGVRLTLATSNSSASFGDVNVGVRWQIDYQNAGDDGPLFATVICDPPSIDRQWNLEHELAANEVRDFYRIQNNDGPPIFSNVTSTAPIVGVPDTSTPDRLVYGRWPSLVGSAWNYAAGEGQCCPDSDSAVLWYDGYQPADGDFLQPGQSARHSVVIFTSPDNIDCGAFTPGCATSITQLPLDQRICVGGSATLDASGIALTDCAGRVDYSWTDGVNTWSGPLVVVTPTQTTSYRALVTCSSDADCFVDESITVVVDEPPAFLPPIAVDPDSCNGGIRISWNAASFPASGGAGFYNVYRSEISCADALSRPPMWQRIAGQAVIDVATRSGGTYYYVVEAEDTSVGGTCPPLGPGGGMVTRLCAPPVTDYLEDVTPAGVGPALRARHQGDAVTMDWTRARALLADEHFHLRKAWIDPADPFIRINREADLSRTFTETDRSAWLQFFDVRVANKCEGEAWPEYPPGFDP